MASSAQAALGQEVVMEARVCACTAAAVCKAALGRIIVPR